MLGLEDSNCPVNAHNSLVHSTTYVWVPDAEQHNTMPPTNFLFLQCCAGDQHHSLTSDSSWRDQGVFQIRPSLGQHDQGLQDSSSLPPPKANLSPLSQNLATNLVQASSIHLYTSPITANCSLPLSSCSPFSSKFLYYQKLLFWN